MLRRRAAGRLAAGLFALPFLQTLEWDFDRCAPLVLVLPALWSGRRVLARAFARFERAPLALRLVAVGVIALALAAALAAERPAAIVALASWALLGTGAVLAGQLAAEEPRALRWWLAAIASSVALGAVLHWVRWRMGADPMTAFYAHFRLMGLHALAGAIAAVALLVGATGGRERILWTVAGTIAWGGLLWSGSRTPVVGAAAGIAALLWRASRDERRPLLLASALLSAGGLALSLLLRVNQENLGVAGAWQRSLGADSLQSFTSNRSVFWAQAWARACEAPWLGYGPDAYRFLEPKLEGAQPHNVFLQWLLDLGAIGALLAAAIVGFALWRGVVRLRTTRPGSTWTAIAVASVVAAQLDGFLYHQLGFVAAALALGIAMAAPGGRDAAAAIPAPRHGRAAGGIAVGAAGVLLAHAWLFHAVHLAPAPAPGSLTARVWHLAPTTTFGLERWIEAWSRTDRDAALALSRRAQTQSPNGDYFHVQTASLLWQRGDHAGARLELEIAHEIAPPAIKPVIEQLQRRMEPPVSRR